MSSKEFWERIEEFDKMTAELEETLEILKKCSEEE